MTHAQPAPTTQPDQATQPARAAVSGCDAQPAPAPAPRPALSVAEARDLARNPLRADFPLLARNPGLHYLDSAATSQRPAQVLEAQRWFQERVNANPLRGVYELSAAATALIEEARKKTARFLHAPAADQVVFTRNTTEALNLLALQWAPLVLGPGDEVAVTILEHHSNLIPWQLACKRAGATLTCLYPDADGTFGDQELDKIGPRTKIVAVTMVSNVLGLRTPLDKIAQRAHAAGATFVVDGAQGAPHLRVDVQDIGCDAFAFSGHKMFAPMGVGVLWARPELLERMEPLYTGGEMVSYVTLQEAGWAQPPSKFEAGTQAAQDIYALGAAIDYVNAVGPEALHAREQELVSYCMQELAKLPYVHVLGAPEPEGHVGVVGFQTDGVHAHDLATILDSLGVAVRAGNHCAQPLLQWLGVDSSCRASFAAYNDKTDVDALMDRIAGYFDSDTTLTSSEVRGAVFRRARGNKAYGEPSVDRYLARVVEVLLSVE